MVTIHVFSDYVCPYCYLEVPILEEAARRFGAQIAVEAHAFELRPEPVPMPVLDAEYLREHWTNRVYPMAEERSLVMRQPSLRTRTRRAHEVAAFARAHGRFPAVDTGLYRAHFEYGRDINDVAVLEDVVREAGLDPAAMRTALESGAFAEAVRADLQLGATLGVRSVPTMLVGETLDDTEPVVGAVPYEWLAGAIDRALFGDRKRAGLRNQASGIRADP